jgi:hypothetical protein
MPSPPSISFTFNDAQAVAQLIAKPPKGWLNASNRSTTEPIQGLLLGVCVSLIASLRHTRLLVHGGLLTWNPETLYTDFEATIMPESDPFALHSESLSIWATGYFLNKAQGNVAASLDVLTFTWALAKRLVAANSFSGVEKRLSKLAGVTPKETGKQPWYFTRADGEPITFAGLWDEWKDKATGEC